MSNEESVNIAEELRKVNKRLDDLVFGTDANEGGGLYSRLNDLKHSYTRLEKTLNDHKDHTVSQIAAIKKDILGLLLWKKFVLGVTAVLLMVWTFVTKKLG